MTIIVVVADIRTDLLDKPQYPEIYCPMTQFPATTARIIALGVTNLSF